MNKNSRSHSVSALLVGEYAGSRLLIEQIFRHAGWRLFEADHAESALKFLRSQRIQVVITDSDLPQWPWKKALEDLRRISPPPQLIVTSRTADDYLWSEVLNLGGYDVLSQPFQRDEIERVVASAGRRYNVQRLERVRHETIHAASVA